MPSLVSQTKSGAMASSFLSLPFLLLVLGCFTFAFGGSSLQSWSAEGSKKCGEGEDPLIMSISQIDLGFSHPQTAVTLSLTCTPASHPPPFFLQCGPGWNQDLVDPSILLLLGNGNCLFFAATAMPMALETEPGPSFTFIYSHSPPLDLTLTLAPPLALFDQD